jgi:hypothetical protein
VPYRRPDDGLVVAPPAVERRVAAPAAAARVRLATGLSWLIALLATLAAAVGLFWRGGAGAYPVSTIRGETVQLYGRGLYQHDTLFAAGGALGNDAVVLLLGVPLLAASTLLLRRGLRWRLLHLGVLVFFLYVYASAALGTVAFNPMFPVYVTLFSASLFAVILAGSSIDLGRLARGLAPAAPRRGLAVFLAVSGAITLAVWGLPLAGALARGEATARLDSYTTEVTVALDLAVITPLVFAAAALVRRREPLGYLLAAALLVLEVMLAPMIAAQTVGQLRAGVTLSAGEVAGPVTGFLVLAAAAAWFLVAITRHLTEEELP